jgi:hypothetical protein
METAKHIYDELADAGKVFSWNPNRICELPFIGEKSTIYQTADNTASRPEPKYVNTNYMFTYGRNEKPSYENFVKYILPRIYSGLVDSGSINTDGSFHIIIVSHGHFLKSVFGPKLDNCEYIVEKNVIKHSDELSFRQKIFGDSFNTAMEYVVTNFSKDFNKYSIEDVVRVRDDCGCFNGQRNHDDEEIEDNYVMVEVDYNFKAVKKSKAKRSKAKRSKAKRSKVKRSKAKRSKAKRSKAKRSKAKRSSRK